MFCFVSFLFDWVFRFSDQIYFINIPYCYHPPSLSSSPSLASCDTWYFVWVVQVYNMLFARIYPAIIASEYATVMAYERKRKKEETKSSDPVIWFVMWSAYLLFAFRERRKSSPIIFRWEITALSEPFVALCSTRRKNQITFECIMY